MKKAIFLDKDGTLIPDIPYNVNPDLINLSEDSVEGLKALVDLGFLLIVISNQSGVGMGYFKEDALKQVEGKIQSLLAPYGIAIYDFFYCPHRPDSNCDCRKPLDGMLRQASARHNIDLNSSWMIGDILNDVQAGNRAGCNTILIDNGNETEWILSSERTPKFFSKSIDQSAEIIFTSLNFPEHKEILQHE